MASLSSNYIAVSPTTKEVAASAATCDQLFTLLASSPIKESRYEIYRLHCEIQTKVSMRIVEMGDDSA